MLSAPSAPGGMRGYHARLPHLRVSVSTGMGTMAPIAVAIWVFATSYAFVGIDEVGIQVEQPFEIVPMMGICSLVMANLEEVFVDVPPDMMVHGD